MVFFNACLMLVLCPLHLDQPQTTRRSPRAELFAAVRIGLAFNLYANGLVETTVVRATLLYYLIPVWSTLISVLWLLEPLTKARVISIIVAFFSLILLLSGNGSAQAPLNIGDLFSFLSGIFWTIGIASLNS